MKHAIPAETALLKGNVPLLAGLLVLLTLLLFWRVSTFEFTNYDDPDYVSHNPVVQQGLTATGITWAFTQAHSFNWHPITWMSHMLDWQLFGDKPGAHHLTSVFFHAANTLLLFLLFWQMTGALWRSAFVAAMFAVHPLHVESVAWVCERKDVLSTFFWLLSTLCYARYAAANKSALPPASSKARASRKHSGGPIFGCLTSGFYLMALVCFALGLMSKPMLVTLPFTLLLLDVWPLRRLSISSGSWRSLVPPSRRLLLEKLPFFALSVGSSVVTFLVQRTQGAVADMQTFAPSLRAANALISYLRYLGKTLWPADLMVFYPYPEAWPGWQVAIAAIVLLVVSIAALLALRKRPFLFVGWFWFIGTLVPVIGLVQVGLQSMADRYMYVPLIGLAVITAWALGEIASGAPGLQKTAIAFAAGVIVACAALTHAQVRVWKNSITLFQHAITVMPNHVMARVMLANAYNDRGAAEPALAHYHEALRLSPRFAEVHYNLGNLYMNQQKVDEAIASYLRAIEHRPGYFEAHANIAVAFGRKQQFQEAVRHYQAALEMNPNEPDLLRNYAMDLISLRQFDRAIELLQRSLQARPNDAVALMFIGDALAGQTKLTEAAAFYDHALQLQPALEDARRKREQLQLR